MYMKAVHSCTGNKSIKNNTTVPVAQCSTYGAGEGVVIVTYLREQVVPEEDELN